MWFPIENGICTVLEIPSNHFLNGETPLMVLNLLDDDKPPTKILVVRKLRAMLV